MKNFILFGLLFGYQLILAQVDTVKVKNGITLYGEIKQINVGVLTMSTSYSDSDFKIDFNEVSSIYVSKKCNIIFSKGKSKVGFLRSENEFEVSFFENESTSNKEVFNLQKIVRLEIFEAIFWKRFSIFFDVGYNLTRRNNAAQFTFSGGLFYKGPGWAFNSDLNSFRSRQDNIAKIQRTNANIDVKRLLIKDWYILGSVGYLSNTQQALKSRYNLRLGKGRYIVSNSKILFGLAIGYNLNYENFSPLVESKSMNELFANVNLNLFNLKNIDLTSKIYYYPSVSKTNRHRIDYNFDVKYKLPFNIYVKTGLQFNYDNQSILLNSDFDYIFTTGLGWKLN